MNLTGQNIRHISSITHDGKVLVFGVDATGVIHYSVKRSGFEDTAVQEGADLFGFEPWKQLRLGDSTDDSSVRDRERETLTDANGNDLLRSVYGKSDEVTKSADAPARLISALQHLYVFRQSRTTNKILVNRFVLDGMTNELVPKFEVRFARSRKRFEPHVSTASKSGKSYDSLDYRDIDGASFFEPALELTFAGTTTNGWFSPVFVPTIEDDRNRWHIFTYSGNKLVLYSVGADDKGTFDVKDYVFAQQDPTDPEKLNHRSIAGIIARTIQLQDLTIAGAPSATTYDVQKEQTTDSGQELMRDATRVMMAVPVKDSTNASRTAVLDFALCIDGTLSQIDGTPDGDSGILRSDAREVVTPLSLLDNIKSYATTNPPPAGIIAAMERGKDDFLQVRSMEALAAGVAAGTKVKLRGTQSYDGHYKVTSVASDRKSFEVEAVFAGNQAGAWEVVPEVQTGLVFDNMIVGTERTAAGKLKVLCSSHDLKVNDPVQISGTCEYDGVYSVHAVDGESNAFVLDAPYFTGEAANLSKVTRRGIRMGGNDSVETPDLKLAQASSKQGMTRTISAWVRVNAASTTERSILKDRGGMMNLALGSNNKVKFEVLMSDGSKLVTTDSETIPTNDTWVHFSGVVEYIAGKSTRTALCRNGVEVANRMTEWKRGHLGNQLIDFDGVDDRVCITYSPDFGYNSASIEFWVRRERSGVAETIVHQGTKDVTRVQIGFRQDDKLYFTYSTSTVETTTRPDQDWHHVACVNDTAISKLRIYWDGKLVGEIGYSERLSATQAQLYFGARAGGVEPFKGNLVDVRIWKAALSGQHILENMRQLPGRSVEPLWGNYLLDDGASEASSRAGSTTQRGSFYGNPKWRTTEYLVLDQFPQSTTETPNSVYIIGEAFQGEIADAQIWNVARSAAEVKAKMYLPLTGGEKGLEAYYPLGAIVYEQNPPTVPDLAHHGRNATVKGAPHAGARFLPRKTSSNENIVKYASDELVVVSQRGVYEETFEFKVTTPEASFDPNNINGTRQKLFKFSYWGKSSHGSKQVISFPSESVTQYDFTRRSDGWYEAKCTVMVPDGVSLMRAFEISEVTGKSTNDWTAIDIRKHHLRLVSDAITKKTYTDAMRLESLPGQKDDARNKLVALRRAEEKVARHELEIADLVVRLDVAKNTTRYTKEKTDLEAQRLKDQAAKSAAEAERDRITNEPLNYWYQFKNRKSGMAMYATDKNLIKQTEPKEDSHAQHFRMEAVENEVNSFRLHCRAKDGYPVTAKDPGSSDVDLEPKNSSLNRQKWFFNDVPGGYLHIKSQWRDYEGLEVWCEGMFDGEKVVHWPTRDNNAYHQQWQRIKTKDLTTSAQKNYDLKLKEIEWLDGQIAAANARIKWLTDVLSSPESQSALESSLATARGQLDTARTELRTANTQALASITTVQAVGMPSIATDTRSLETRAGLLGFAQPIGAAALQESADGNVLLTYFDKNGRIRSTTYDATADTRNSVFGQWLPDDTARACVDLRDPSDKITLNTAIALPQTGWTIEAWVHYPLTTTPEGIALPKNIIAGSETDLNAPLLVQRGNRLGLLAGGWFFDSGADLERTLGIGWHHFAVSTVGDKTTFYADGAPMGSRMTTQPALRLNGTDDFVEVPAHANPTEKLTVSVWARSAIANWNQDGCLVSKTNAFIMSPMVNTKTMRFQIYIGSVCKTITATVANIQEWHLYTGTYDGVNLRLYIDGELATEVACTGKIAADPGALRIGQYEGNHLMRFKGDIAEVAYWEVARGQGQVRDDFRRQITDNEPGLIGLWPMALIEGTGGKKVKDLVSGRDGVVTGSPKDVSMSTIHGASVKVLGNSPAGSCPVGRLAEVRLWNVALSDAEISANSRATLTANEPELVGYFPLDERTGTTACNRAGGRNTDGTMSGVDWMGFTANLGNPGTRALNLPSSGKASVTCTSVDINNKRFTIEFWARRSGPSNQTNQIIISLGTSTTNKGLQIGFLGDNKFKFGFWGNDLDTSNVYTDTDWHHWCCTYDGTSQRIYCDGTEVTSRQSASFTGTGNLQIGRKFTQDEQMFLGDITEVRVWDKARTPEEIRSTMYTRLSGSEPNLLANYPLDALIGQNTVIDKKSGLASGTLNGSAKVLSWTSVPIGGGNAVVMSEYSTTQVDTDGRTQSLLRRCYAYATGGNAKLWPEQRVEELTLQWVGNAQINPTLLGFIEGAPPVPSENLTESDDGYKGATTVTLAQSSNITYSWKRSQGRSAGFKLESFVGAAWEGGAGIGFVTKVTEGEAGGVGNYTYEKKSANESNVAATSSLQTSDRLTLTGAFEDKPMSRTLGRRWTPKNVGYALVISGMADVFVTKLKRSRRMVSYDIRPVQGIPLDVNTITFLMNPTYTLNGSLDGLVGSMPADATFYPHVPEMRAQYGSLYPASYYRIEEAYALKEAIDRQDKERESFFYNFDVWNLDSLESYSTTSTPSLSSGSASSEMDQAQLDEQAKAAEAEAAQRQAEIEALTNSIDSKTRASAAFADWQIRMEGIQARAGKRNIVNTYVWDADGGLRAEEQSFASTIEHSMNTETSSGGEGGISQENMIAGFKAKLSALGCGGETWAMSKTLSTGKALQLNVDLSGVESDGVTDLRDNPLKPGQKVGRYRFMSFYLEGSTDHFYDFFTQVVDPEWLQGNGEEARALRQAKSKPNKCWRVLHRVTYVERPALLGVGR